jgi:peptidase YpeB-like protein
MKAKMAGVVAVVMAGLALAAVAIANDSALLKQAKITEAQAREIALKQAPGTVKESEPEKEKGALVWSFDIDNGKDITEVLVSAIDGHIVSTEHESYKKEAAEKAKEAKEKKAAKPKDNKDSKEHH